MHEDLKIESICDYMRKIVNNYFGRIKSHLNLLVRNILYDTTVNYKHKRIMSFI